MSPKELALSARLPQKSDRIENTICNILFVHYPVFQSFVSFVSRFLLLLSVSVSVSVLLCLSACQPGRLSVCHSVFLCRL